MKIDLFTPVLTYPDPTSPVFPGHAAAIARRLDATLSALVIDVDIRTPASAFGGLFLDVPRMVAEAEARSRACGEDLEASVREAAASAGVDVTVEAGRFFPEAMCTEPAVRARLHDISAIGWQARQDRIGELAESLIFDSGRPVLLVPDATVVERLGHVAIAWDGSRAAARALADAAPFLDRAERVTVLTALGDKPLDASLAEALVARLEAKGIAAVADVADATEEGIGIALQRRALDLGAGLLVMGGYGHSRLREFALGGATRDVLTDLRLPVLMSH